MRPITEIGSPMRVKAAIIHVCAQPPNVLQTPLKPLSCRFRRMRLQKAHQIREHNPFAYIPQF
jgi:hypothetical protein